MRSVEYDGRRFASFQALCVHCGVSESTARSRLRRGRTLGEAMTRHRLSGGGAAVDHTGRAFPTVKAMCRAWGVSYATYKSRLRRGAALSSALTSAVGKYAPRQRVDHTGREFGSHIALCRAWGVAPATLRYRLSRGWSLKEALEGRR